MRAVDDLRTHLQAVVASMGFSWPEKCVVEAPKEAGHGDLSTNLAMLLAKEARRNPRSIAEEIAAALMQNVPDIAHAEAAGPGFCNCVFNPSYWQKVVRQVEDEGDEYGKNKAGGGKKVLVEFVSANPTGPLHIGHGRGAAYGDSLARLLAACGYAVSTEYYINDAGRQMRMLGLSVLLRAKELNNREFTWPEEYYRGAYIIDLAKEFLTKEPGLLALPEEEGIARCTRFAMEKILAGIKDDLRDFRVRQETFFSEKSLVASNAVQNAFQSLDAAGRTYEKDNAYWFETTKEGDDRDRVLRKSDGSLTYFASDIAYHHNKYERGFDWLIDVWGADHHGYIPRMRAAIAAMGRDQKSFDVVLIQLVNLMKDGKPLSMSTRAGTFETLHDVVELVGADACRFMFLSRKSDSPLDFDLDLVRQRNLENPVYYVQYAHARICALLRKADERGILLPEHTPESVLALLTRADDVALLRKAASYTDVLIDAARTLGVHHISRYATELAGLVHSFYAREKILGTDEESLALARLALLRAIARILANALHLLGVSAPLEM
ncbi:MAG: arginine--tRNA ligase [Desulfovibrionaceae bacterium]|nr:arginine--tRNA ligase [Desulfovibrionaceae bacterium]